MNHRETIAIITPTHKRPQLLKKTIQSVKEQNLTECKHIIVNDSPFDDYSEVEKELKHGKRIVYLKNKENYGKNKSLDRALNYLKEEKFAGSIMFLDDDDTLAPGALLFLTKVLEETKRPWIVTNRAYKNGDSITVNETSRNYISYSRDYLLCKRFRGDATHLIRTPFCFDIQFPTNIHSGEEWLYFSELEKRVGDFLYIDHNSTLTDGYLSEGVTKRYKTPPYTLLLKELSHRDILTTPLLLYLLGRSIKNILRKIFSN